MSTTVAMPQLGESVVEGTVGKWRVREGERIEKDQPLVEIMTDKADSEVPSPLAGVVVKLLVAEGDVIKVGAGLVQIDANATATAAKPAAEAPKPAVSAPLPAAAPVVSAPLPAVASTADVKGSPSVRKLIREHDVDPATLKSGEGRGPISHDDVIRAASGEGPRTSPGGLPAPAPLPSAPASSASNKAFAFQVPPYVAKPGDEVVKFSRRRRIIADHMVYSKLTSPHVVTVAECDLHKTWKLREEHKNALKKEGVNLTYLAFICAAVTRALRENKSMNARVLDDAFVLLRDINLGIAVDTPDGLVVPVIRNADELTVRGIAKSIDVMAKKARDGKLTPDDLAAKSFTVSNPGLKGNLHGGAIISQPNVGILRIGEIQKRVVVIEHDGEDLMAIRPVMYMSLSYDHRIVDGVAANSFLHRVVEILETADFVL